MDPTAVKFIFLFSIQYIIMPKIDKTKIDSANYKIDKSFMNLVEGHSQSAYVPTKGKPAQIDQNSGVTIATGVDLAAQDYKQLTKFGLDAQLAKKLQPYCKKSLRGSEAVNYLAKNPLKISADQAKQLDATVERKYIYRTEQLLNGKLSSHPAEVQTLAYSRVYHSWNLPPKMAEAIKNQQYEKVPEIIRNSKLKGLEGRFDKQASYIEKALQNKQNKSTSSLSTSASERSYSYAKMGSSGQNIVGLQKNLANLGFLSKNQIDGKFGPQTELAVRSYQQKNGLKVDGIVGSQTFNHMKSNHKLGGVEMIFDIQSTIKQLPKIYGVKLDQKSQKLQFIVNPGKSIQCSEIDLEYLCIGLKIFTQVNTTSIAFSLDPAIPEKPDGPNIRKVYYPDERVGKKLLEGTRLGKLLFDCDFYMKMFGLGIDQKLKPFNYPQQFPNLLPYYKYSKEPVLERPTEYSRFWLICKSLDAESVEAKHKQTLIMKKAVIAVNAQQMVRNEKGRLEDRKVIDKSHQCYIFAERMSEVYAQVCQCYPMFKELQLAYKSIAVAKWIFEHRIPIDTEHVDRIYTAAKTDKSSNLIPALFAQIDIDKKSKLHLFGGVDMNMDIKTFKDDTSTEASEDFDTIDCFLVKGKNCEVCNKVLNVQELTYCEQRFCEVHHKNSCGVCHKLVKDGITCNQLAFHKDCFPTYQQTLTRNNIIETAQKNNDMLLKHFKLGMDELVVIDKYNHKFYSQDTYICEICKQQTGDSITCNNCGFICQKLLLNVLNNVYKE